MTLDDFITALEEADQVVVNDTPSVMGEVVYPGTDQETARAMVVLHRHYLALKTTTQIWKNDPTGAHPPVLMPIAMHAEYWETPTLASDALQRVKEVVARRGLKFAHERRGNWREVA